LLIDALTSGPNRAPDRPHHADMRCWLLLLLSLLPVSLLLTLLLLMLSLALLV